MSAAVNTAVFNALDTNHDGVISRAEFGGGASVGAYAGGASVQGASVGVPAMTYAAPAPAYSASPFTYAPSTVMPAQTYGAPQAYMSAPTYAAPIQTFSGGASGLVSAHSFVGGGGASTMTYGAPQMTYAAPQAVTYAAPPVTYAAPQYADGFAQMEAGMDAEFAGSQFASVSAPAYGGGMTYGAPAAYQFGGGATHTIGPTYGAPQAGYGGGAYTQGKVYEPVLFTQESFLAYQTQGVSALPVPEASVAEFTPEAPVIATEAAAAPAAKTKDVEVPAKKKSSKKSKKSSKKKKGCC